jgi:hypothetical protein
MRVIALLSYNTELGKLEDKQYWCCNSEEVAMMSQVHDAQLKNWSVTTWQ